MERKKRFISWGVYTIACFFIMLIGFSVKISIPLSIIIGFICGLLNEIINILRSINDKKQGGVSI